MSWRFELRRTPLRALASFTSHVLQGTNWSRVANVYGSMPEGIPPGDLAARCTHLRFRTLAEAKAACARLAPGCDAVLEDGGVACDAYLQLNSQLNSPAQGAGSQRACQRFVPGERIVWRHLVARSYTSIVVR